MAEHPTPEQEIIFSREDESITTPELEDNESSDTSSTEHITTEEVVRDLHQDQEALLRDDLARAVLATQRNFLEQQDTEPDNTMSRWLITARSDQQAQGMAVAVKREDRAALSADALIKLQKATTEGMTHKFSLMSHQSDDQLVDCYNLTLRIEELKQRLKETDTIGGFDIFESAIRTPQDPMPRELRLIDTSDLMTELLVRASMKFKRYYGQTYDVQDLQWSQALVKNSCDDDLATKVMERLRKVPDEEQGGALFYFTMIKLIQTDTEQAVRVLTDKLEKLSLKTLTGENVYTACSLIRGVVERLEIVNKVPHDVETTVLKILQTSSVDKFNSTFATLEESRFLGMVTNKTVDDILILAELKYTSVMSDDGWTGHGRVGKSTFIMADDNTVTIGKSSFLIGEDGEIKAVQDQSSNTCWECGAKGHLSWQCPQKRGGAGRGGDGGANGNGAPGGGGGGGGGGGDSETKKKQKNPKHIPPAAGEPTKRVVKGMTLYWCQHCKSWNTTHVTDQHKAKQAANVAEEVADDPSSLTDDNVTKSTRVSFYGNVARQLAGVKK
jgi:uncharacterized membrane protein YgcG